MWVTNPSYKNNQYFPIKVKAKSVSISTDIASAKHSLIHIIENRAVLFRTELRTDPI